MWLEQISKADHTVQRSEAWIEWRKKHIGASEVGAVLGISEFQTEHDLWLVKTGKKEGFKGNFATQRGTDAEPRIKELYEAKTGKKIVGEPVLEYKDWNVMSASLDGITEDGIVVEVKYPSKAKHEEAKSGFVPTNYECQLQTQMLVAGSDIAHYVSYDGEDIAIVEVHANKVFQAHIVEECKRFWNLVENNIEPELPFIKMENQQAEDMLAEYYNIDEQIKSLEDRKDFIKKQVKEIVGENKTKIGSYTLQMIERKGNVEYGKIPELKGVDLEKYRKSAIRYFDIKRSK